jgi:hypothetical protein
MRFNDAKKLYKGDEVRVKEDKDIVKVISVNIMKGWKKPTVIIETVSEYNGWQEYFHTEIE